MNRSKQKIKVLFLCTHNSARSQTAEGLLRDLKRDRYEAYSAGTEPGTIHPYAVRVMAEIGMDISLHRSKNMGEFVGFPIDMVITRLRSRERELPDLPRRCAKDPSKL